MLTRWRWLTAAWACLTISSTSSRICWHENLQLGGAVYWLRLGPCNALLGSPDSDTAFNVLSAFAAWKHRCKIYVTAKVIITHHTCFLIKHSEKFNMNASFLCNRHYTVGGKPASSYQPKNILVVWSSMDLSRETWPCPKI